MNDVFWGLYLAAVCIGCGMFGFYVGKLFSNKEANNTDGLDYEECNHCGESDSYESKKYAIKSNDDKYEVILHWRCLAKILKYSSDKLKKDYE